MSPKLQSSCVGYGFKVLTAATICFMLMLASAAGQSWNNDSDGFWSGVPNNYWTGGVVPNAIGAVVNFNIDIAANRTITLDQGATVGTLNFGETTTGSAGSWIISDPSGSNILTLDNGLSTPTVITVNALGTGKVAQINANMAGANGLTKAGVGALTLSGTNTYSGNTTLSAGTLNINNAAALGTSTLIISTGTIDNTSGAAITTSTNNNVQQWDGDFSFTGSYNLNLGTGAVTINNSTRQVTVNAGTLSVGGSIASSSSGYGLTKAGAGALTLSGANSYTGNTTLNAGTLNINNASALSTGTFIINGGTIDNTSGAAITLSNATQHQWNGNFTFGGTQNLSFSNGTVLLGGNITVTVNGTPPTGTQAGNLTVGQISDTPTGGSSQGYSLTKNGPGTLYLYNPATYTGDTYINAGTIDADRNADNIPFVSASTVHFGNNTQLILYGHSNANSLTCGVDIGANNATLAMRAAGGLAPTTVTGSGILTLSCLGKDNNTITMGVTAGTASQHGWSDFTGTLQLRQNIGTTDGMTFRVNSNIQIYNTTNPWALDIGPYCTYAAYFGSADSNVATLGGLSGGDGTSWLQSRSGSGTFQIGSLNTNTTYAGSISNGSGTISLTKVGTGTLTLTGTGNGYYTGTTTINDGTLQIGNATATGTLGTGAVTNNSPVVTGGLVFNRNNSLDVPNAISGTGSIAVKGGTIYFNNASVANPISVSSGATLGGQGVITKAVTVTAGGTIEDGQVGFSGTKLTVGSLTFSGAGTINYNQPTGTNPLTVTGGVTTNGAGSVSINIYGTSLNNGTYDLIKYGTSITNINAFTLVTVPPSGALRAKIYSLVDNSGNKEVDLSVTGADNNITWVGALGAGVWDSDATVNWKMTAPPNAASKFYIGDNVTFDDSGAKTVNISSADVQPSSVTFTNTVGNDYIIQGAFGIANGPSLHKASGAGKVTILTNNSYNGGTTINAGTISIAADGLNAGNSAPLGVVPLAATAGNVVINGGTLNSSNTITLHANRGVALGPTFGFTGSGTIDVDNGQEFTVAGVVANNGDPVAGYGTGNLIKTGLGTLTLSNANTFSGTTTISGGILRLGNPLALQNSTLNYIYPGGTGGTISFGALTGTIGDGHSGTTPETGITNIQGLNGSQDLSISNDTGGAVLFQVGNGSVDCAYSGAITGAGSLLKTGTGTMTLTGNSSYSGATYFNRGNVIVSAGGLATGAAMHIANDVPGYGSGSSIATVTFSGSSISSFSALDIGTNSRAGGNFTIQDSASVTVTGNFDVNNEETAGGDSTVTTNNQINLNGGTLIFNGGTFIKSNNQIGHAHLAAINFNGGTIMGYGTLLPADDYSAVTGAVMYFEGVTCNVQAGGAKIDDGGNTIQINHALVHDPAIVSPATDGGLTKSGAGTLILTGTNTYTGGTIVNAGTLQLGYNNTNLSGGTLGTGGVVLNNSSVLSFNRSDSFTIANLISGNGSVIQQCYGSTAILTAANTYTGATTVSQGTLSLNGVQATSGVTVNSGAGLAVGSSGMTIGTLTFGSTDTDTETLSCTGSSITTINVTSSNGLTAYGNGSTTGTYVNPGLQVYQTGTYALVNYKGTIQGSGFGAFVLALPIRVVGSLTNNTNDPSNPYIKLQITDVNYPVWTGTVLNVGTGTYDWNIGNLNPDGTPGSGIQNWKEYSNPSVATVYQEGPPADAVFFDNSATHTTVNITTTVSPSLVTVNNTTKTYSFIGDYGIGGTGSLIKSGSGTLTIATTNSYSGGTTLNDGTLNINKATALGTGMFTINGGTIDNTSGADIVMSNNNAQTWNGVFAFTGTKNLDFGTGAVTLAGSSSITIGGTGNLKVDHIASSTYDLTKAGAGTLSLTGSYLDTSVSTLYISGSFGALNLTGGTLEIANDTHVTGLSGSGTIQPYLTADKWFFVNNALGADYSFSGVIQSGAGKMGLNKNGSGTLTLTGSNTYTGTTTVVLGNLTVSGSGGINTGGLGLIVVGDTDYTGNAASITFQNSTISSFASLNFGGGVRSGGNFTIGDTASVTVIGNFDLNNEIAGSQIATNNIVSLNGGTLTVGAFTKTSTGLTGNDATHLATINFNGGTLTGNGTILPALIGLTAKVQLGGAKINVSDGYGIEIDQPMIHDTALGTAADGGLTKSGAGTLLITGSNNFNGDTVISLGGLTLDNSFALGSSTLYYDNQGGTLSFGSLVNVTLGGLKGAESKALINGSSAAIALTVGTNDFDNTYTGILSGSGSTLTKTGTGTQILGGNNSYTGATTVNNGTLELSTNGQIAAASAISTGSSGTFEVNGGTHTVSTISGSGTTKVLGDGSLTATSIVQDTLDIGSGSWATLNIAAFDGGSTSGSLSEVPEPATWAMLMLAAMGLGIYWRRRR